MSRVALIVLLAVVATVSSSHIGGVGSVNPSRYVQQFNRWMDQYNVTYPNSTVQSQRLMIFSQNMQFIENHDEAKAGFGVGMNQFGDLTVAEFSAIYNGYRDIPNRARHYATFSAKAVGDAPPTMDWRTKNVVTPIKNQGQCGSCWSFSATGSMEGQHALSTGTLVSLSEQNLMDCSTAQGNEGCDGGLPDWAFQYVIKNGGVDTESSYPYTAQDGRCHYSASNSGATISSFKDVQKGSEDALLAASSTIGPISVAIDASHSSFQFYTHGVYYEPACSTSQLDHAVLVIGYGNLSGTDYWLVKNSWGTTWGMQGFIYMSRDKNNNCGIATSASYPIVGSSPAATTAQTKSGNSQSSGQTGQSSGQTGQSSGQTGQSSGQTGQSSGQSSGESTGQSSGQTSGQSSGQSSGSGEAYLKM